MKPSGPAFIRHRINTAEVLRSVAREHGAEIDLRTNVSEQGKIHLSHDPWALGESWDAWLASFVEWKIRGTLILNTKEDGLEEKVMQDLERAGVDNYFFLDTALPTLVRWVRQGLGARFAVRVSKYEPIEGLQAFRGQVRWAWVDCFDGEPMGPSEVARLKPDFKICLVSPELQKRPLEEISRFKDLLPLADAICTKSPENWISLPAGGSERARKK